MGEEMKTVTKFLAFSAVSAQNDVYPEVNTEVVPVLCGENSEWIDFSYGCASTCDSLVDQRFDLSSCYGGDDSGTCRCNHNYVLREEGGECIPMEECPGWDEATSCERESMRANYVSQQGIMDHNIPSCGEDGEWERQQCGMMGCWCVYRDGTMIEGSMQHSWIPQTVTIGPQTVPPEAVGPQHEITQPPECNREILDCETYGFCMRHGPSDANWGAAKRYCERNGMRLPFPRNDAENAQYAAVGPTWIALNVNDALNGNLPYNNWGRKSRGYMNSDGQWSDKNALERMPYFCVPEVNTCENFLDMFICQSGNWLQLNDERDFEYLELDRSGDFEVGAVISLRCGERWNRRSDSSFICVRQQGNAAWVKCNSQKCTRYNRNQMFDIAQNMDAISCE